MVELGKVLGCSRAWIACTQPRVRSPALHMINTVARVCDPIRSSKSSAATNKVWNQPWTKDSEKNKILIVLVLFLGGPAHICTLNSIAIFLRKTPQTYVRVRCHKRSLPLTVWLASIKLNSPVLTSQVLNSKNCHLRNGNVMPHFHSKKGTIFLLHDVLFFQFPWREADLLGHGMSFRVTQGCTQLSSTRC